MLYLRWAACGCEPFERAKGEVRNEYQFKPCESPSFEEPASRCALDARWAVTCRICKGTEA
jgi:hypothetical protein